ncbi:unnamed protein product [Urochloa humidicola]
MAAAVSKTELNSSCDAYLLHYLHVQLLRLVVARVAGFTASSSAAGKKQRDLAGRGGRGLHQADSLESVRKGIRDMSYVPTF